MMHECSLGESTRQGYIHASCWPFGSVSTPQGRHDAWMQPWWVDSPGLHSCIMTTNGYNSLKHCAALKGLGTTDVIIQIKEMWVELFLALYSRQLVYEEETKKYQVISTSGSYNLFMGIHMFLQWQIPLIILKGQHSALMHYALLLAWVAH